VGVSLHADPRSEAPSVSRRQFCCALTVSFYLDHMTKEFRMGHEEVSIQKAQAQRRGINPWLIFSFRQTNLALWGPAHVV
jgi:hypothetical protein